MAGAFVNHSLVALAGGFHLFLRVRNRRADARVAASVETVYRSFHLRHRIGGGRRTVENEGGCQIGTVGGEAERLATAPAEARHIQLAIRSRKFFAVIGGGVEIGCDLVGW